MREKSIFRIFKIIFIVLVVLILLVFIIRLFSSRHLDDLNPGIPCDEGLIKKASYLVIIPKYNNISIADNKEWCDYIKGFNKNLVMHGVYHTYDEFNTPRDYDYIQEGRKIFVDCFGIAPTEFKAPQLALSKDNEKILRERFNFRIYTKFNQIFHKVYHCNDTGFLSNKVQAWI